MFRRFRFFKQKSEAEESGSPLPVSLIDISTFTRPQQDKKRIRSGKTGPRRSQVDRAPSWPGARKTPTRKLSTNSNRTKTLDNGRSVTPAPASQRHVYTSGETRSMVTPTSSPRPRHSLDANPTSSRKATQNLPPPKSPPFRVTLRRKGSKPPQKTKSQIIREEVEEKYDENGTLHRTTITKTRNSDGTSSTLKRKQSLNPTSPEYRPKPKALSSKRSKDKLKKSHEAKWDSRER
jgi:hypothetical protein